MAGNVPWYLQAQQLADARRASEQQYQLGRETSGQYNALLSKSATNWGDELSYPGLPPLSPRPPVKTFSTPAGERPNPAYAEWLQLAEQYRQAAETPSPMMRNQAYQGETERLGALGGLLKK
jgi:hypothetical protein